MSTSTPQGVVALLVAPDGHVVAEAADFGLNSCEQQQNQEFRALLALQNVAMDRMCNPGIAKAASPLSREQILNEMVRSGGYELKIVPVGYEEDGDG